jgi:hypothetical protein
MADKKDKSKETKGSVQKAAPKSAKADGKPKAQAKETKKAAKPAATSEVGVAKAAPVKSEPPRMQLQKRNRYSGADEGIQLQEPDAGPEAGKNSSQCRFG